MFACEKGTLVEVIKALLDRGAEINTTYYVRATLVYACCMYTLVVVRFVF